MRHRIPLPKQLGAHFTVREAAELGVSRGRRDARDLARPFYGVRATRRPESFRDLVLSYAPRMRPRQRLVGRSAMRAWGLPVPRPWSPREPLEIAAPQEDSPPRTRGVRGRHLCASRARTWLLGRIPVVDPVAAVFSSASELSVPEAVTLLDAVVTSASNYPSLVSGRPVFSREEILGRLVEWGRFRGSATIRAAVERMREGVESPKETETRLAIVDDGLPEPLVQHEVFDDGRLIARVDLAYPQWKIAIEYEGDGHRTDKAQWRADIRRQRELEDLGWIVIRLTQDDLTHPADYLRRIRRAIASRAA